MSFNDHCELLIQGEEVDRDALVQTLIRAGYQTCELVQQQGDLAIRGGIVDIFPPAHDPDNGTGPLRLDFFGDTLETIRIFDPVSQRSVDQLEEAVLLPASDMLFPQKQGKGLWQEALTKVQTNINGPLTSHIQIKDYFSQEYRFPVSSLCLAAPLWRHEKLHCFFDYLPEQCSLFVYDPFGVQQSLDIVRERIAANYNEAVAGEVAALPPNELFLSKEETEKPSTRLGSRHGLSNFPIRIIPNLP